MNTERLSDFLTLILAEERRVGIQQRLQELNQSFGNLQNQPQNTGFQSQAAQGIVALGKAIDSIYDKFTPAQIALLNEIGGTRFFSPILVEEIQTEFRQNGMTPNVMFQKIAQLIGEREPFIRNIEALRNSLTALKLTTKPLAPGEAEIGFLLPRSLFQNHLDHFIDQLRVINRIIRLFSELVTGKVEPIIVHQISSSDPLLFFGLNPVTIAEIGGAVTWALATWKQVLDIKKLYNDAVKMKLSDKFTGGLEQEINNRIETGINEKIKELESKLAPAFKENQERKNELINGLRWALQSIFARIERGMSVEIRFVPPPQPITKPDSKEKPAAIQPVFIELDSVSHKLDFPVPLPNPVLALPGNEPPPPPPPKGRKLATGDDG